MKSTDGKNGAAEAARPETGGGCDKNMVAAAIVNVNNELKKLDTRAKLVAGYSKAKMERFSEIYDDLIGLLSRYPQFPVDVIGQHDINLFYPLMKLISVNLSQGHWKEVSRLIDTFGVLVWHHLNHPFLYKSLVKDFCADESIVQQFCKLIFELAPKGRRADSMYMYWFTRKVMKPGSEETRELSYAHSVGFVKLVTENISRFHSQLSNLDGMCTGSVSSKDENKALTELLVKLIGEMEVDPERELLTLMCTSMGLLDKLETLRQQEISGINKKCIGKFIEVSRNTLLWQDPAIISSKQAFADMAKNKSMSIRSDCKYSLLFLLEILDHRDTFNYLESHSLLCYLSFSLKNLNNLSLNGKMELYLHYNQLNSKVSLTALLAHLNFVLASSFLSSFGDNEDIPDIITNHFNQSRLPPLPKSDYFFDNIYSTDAFDNDLNLANNKGNVSRLVHCISLNLNLLLQLLKDEFYSISIMNTYSTDQINLKLIFRSIGLIFSSLFTSLVALRKLDDYDKFDVRLSQDFIIDIYSQLVSMDMKCTQNTLTWVCLINFASDVCYFDLRYVPIFESLFNTLMQKSESSKVLEDQLVKSGLSFFFSTFDNGNFNYAMVGKFTDVSKQTHANSPLVEIEYHEYEFMYAHLQGNQDALSKDRRVQTFPGNEQTTNPPYNNPSMLKEQNNYTYSKQQFNTQPNNDLLFIFEPEIANISTPLKSNYATNFARQQSIHVDQYGKT